MRVNAATYVVASSKLAPRWHRSSWSAPPSMPQNRKVPARREGLTHRGNCAAKHNEPKPLSKEGLRAEERTSTKQVNGAAKNTAPGKGTRW